VARVRHRSAARGTVGQALRPAQRVQGLLHGQQHRLPPDRVRLAEIAFLTALSTCIALLSIGVVRRWRWVFWLILVASRPMQQRPRGPEGAGSTQSSLGAFRRRR